MITLTDASLLAVTKLKTRKIRTITTIVLASLLFGVLIAVSLVMTGAFRSVDSFREDGLTGRHIVEVLNPPPAADSLQKTLSDPTMVAKAKRRYEELVSEKKAEAARLGIQYSEAGESSPLRMRGEDDPEALVPRDSNGIVERLLAEKYGSEPAFDDAKLGEIAQKYGAIARFEEQTFSVKNGSSLNRLKDGKEAFYDWSDEAETKAYRIEPLIRDDLMILSAPTITESFRLPDDAGWTPESGSIPIILSQDVVEQLLGLEKLSDKSSPSEKLARITDTREKAKNLTVSLCYRNSASSDLIQRTIQQQKEIKAHKDDTKYQMPKVIYELPDPAACSSPTIAKDTRYAYEKQQDEKQKQFDEKFGKVTDPISYFVSFKVVGVSPPTYMQDNGGPQSDAPQIRNLGDVVNNLLRTSGIWQAIPVDLYEQIPDTSEYADIFTFEPTYWFGSEDNKMRFVEFANSADAQRFIDEQGCELEFGNTCRPDDGPYLVYAVFGNSAAIDDIRDRSQDLFSYATIGVMTLAVVIMWIAVGRTIADGRRETAVFRAIGFKRVDIATVYVLYTFLLSVLIAACAAVLGFLAAYIVHRRFSPDLTTQAQYNFGGLDLSKEIHLLGVDERQLGFVLAACLGVGLLSVVVPLLRNVRRNPIRDMRDEG